MNSDMMEKLIGTTDITVVDAMSLIDKNAKGILFVVDDNKKLVGTLTDGDIRRWILKSGELTDFVTEVMNKEPKSLLESDRGDAYSFLLENDITAVPIIDNNHKIIDIVVRDDENQLSSEIHKKKLLSVPVVIMAGGKGTRLYPFTKILPKPLIPIGETPIVERILNCFTEYGINNFYMTVNYKKGMIRSYFYDLKPNYIINYIEEEQPLGTAGSIKLIKDKFEQPIFVINCDAIIIADYADIYDYHIESGNSVTVVTALKNIVVPYGVVHTGEDGELEEIEEKPRLSYFINTGMYVIDPKMIELIPNDTFFHMTHLIDVAIKNGAKVGTYPISEDSFLDMGELDEMKRMEQKLNVISDR